MSNRPKIKVPIESMDYVIELISITLLVLMWYYTISQYSGLPETIATHFNAKGEPDDFGSKTMVWLLPILGTVIYIGMLVLTRYPHLHNYMVNITKENALKNYRFSIRVLRIVNLCCALLFAYITYHIIQSAKGNALTLGSWFLPIVIGLSVLLPLLLFIYQKKINKS